MPCTCSASTLALFTRRLAYIDLKTTVRHTIDWRTFGISRCKFSNYQSLQFQHTTRNRNNITTSYPETRLNELIPFDPSSSTGRLASSRQRRSPLKPASFEEPGGEEQTVGGARGEHPSAPTANSVAVTSKVAGDGVGSDTSNQFLHGFSSPSAHSDQGGAAVLEITSETIDALAAKSRQDSCRMTTKPTRSLPYTLQVNPKDTRNGLALRYSSLRASSTSEIRALQKRGSNVSTSRPSTATARGHDIPVLEREPWQVQKAALKEKFKEGWNPRKRLSPDALAGIRAIHAQFPEQYTTSILAEKFEVSPEAIRRILKSRWTPNKEEELDRQRRWFSRGQKVWSRYAELGLKPPARWRTLGIGKREQSIEGTNPRSRGHTNITVRSADHAVGRSDDECGGYTLAERIL